MKVREQMTRPVVTVTALTPLGEARNLLRSTHLRCLPVVTTHDRLVGLLLDRDDRIHRAPADSPVGDVMAPADVCIGPTARIERAAQLMLEHDIRGLPVTDGAGTLLGVLTATDLLAAMVKVPPVLLWV